MAKRRFNPYNLGLAQEREWNRTQPQRDSALAAQRDSTHLATMGRLTENLRKKNKSGKPYVAQSKYRAAAEDFFKGLKGR